ncbi:MAG: peptidylprolyl isomerase [Pseudomonadota bacterium]
MQIYRSLAAWIAAFVLATGPVMAQDDAVTGNTVVATVNGTEITLAHMVVLRSRLPEQYRNLPPEVLFDGILEQMVQQTLLSQMTEIDREGELVLENERRALLASAAIQNAADAAVTEDALQAAYDATFGSAEAEEEFNASHILVETEERAAELITELAGGADFATLAQENSTGPSGPNGGELGWFGAGMMVPPFEAAVFELEVGAVAPSPVQTQFGWHVIKLNDKRVKEAPALAEVRDQLVDQVQREAIDAMLAELTAGAEITQVEAGEIDPNVILDMSLVTE